MRVRSRWLIALSIVIPLLGVAVPSGVRAYYQWRDYKERSRLQSFLTSPLAGDEGWHERLPPEESPDEDFEPRGDDARRRGIYAMALWGSPSPEYTAERARIAHAEKLKWGELFPRPERPARGESLLPQPPPGPLGTSWLSLGPTFANFEWNGGDYEGVDSGRPTAIAVHPTDPQQVYLATSGGGLWKTWEFGSDNPLWTPIGDSLPSLAVGAMALDPNAPDTLYVGTGDSYDVPGGQLVKSTDGGGTWSAPIALSGNSPGIAVLAQRIRKIQVDPANSNIVLVATEVGLFRSTDAGASYQLVDLPNASTQQVAESIWSIVYTGQVGGVSRWAVSGVPACSATVKPPAPGTGSLAGGTCTLGNAGDIWITPDAGATWASRRAAQALPARAVGRITLAAGTPSASTPPTTVIYAQLSNQDEAANGGAGFWRSGDSGATFTDATGVVTNPTSGGSLADCPTPNVNGAQDWYNAALAVDPANDGNVIAGGQLCGIRTTNGVSSFPSWENVAHWLPPGGGGVTGGQLPYVHADWHAATVVRTATGYRVLVGTDGGLFWSDNAFTALPPAIVWHVANRGLVTHLAYSVGSGDPANGNPFVVFTGLQDNGTRIRDSLANPTTFNQVIGGDGIGTVASRDPNTGASAFWASANGAQQVCVPSAANNNCNKGGAWTSKKPAAAGCANELSVFFIRYAPVPRAAAPNTFITGTGQSIHRTSGSADWVKVSNCFSANGDPLAVRQVAASPTEDGVFGAALSHGYFAVTSNCSGTNTNCTWKQSAQIGVDLNGDGTMGGNELLRFTSMLAFPPGPTGKPSGDVYVATSSAPVTDDSVSLVDPRIGHIFKTENRGTSFVPLHGNGTGFDLPNVGINVVRYDPADTTNSTLYVGTELGVYRSTDGGNTWRRYGVGLPMVSVTDMFISKNGSMMRVATYGRGIWEIYPSATAERGVAGNGDWDRDQRLDFIDLAALGARLGTNPSTGAAPYYDWNLDMTGSTNAIGDEDLTQLLTKLGERP